MKSYFSLSFVCDASLVFQVSNKKEFNFVGYSIIIAYTTIPLVKHKICVCGRRCNCRRRANCNYYGLENLISIARAHSCFFCIPPLNSTMYWVIIEQLYICCSPQKSFPLIILLFFVENFTDRPRIWLKFASFC